VAIVRVGGATAINLRMVVVEVDLTPELELVALALCVRVEVLYAVNSIRK
jgi:hypothetical protein